MVKSMYLIRFFQDYIAVSGYVFQRGTRSSRFKQTDFTAGITDHESYGPGMHELGETQLINGTDPVRKNFWVFVPK